MPTDTTISRARRQFGLLQEYRTRLIADVVTGKLDVCKAAANLLDEIDEPESCDHGYVLSDGGENMGNGFDVAPEVTA